jgi:hypothetical protein
MCHLYFDTDLSYKTGYLYGGGGDYDLDIFNKYGQGEQTDVNEKVTQQWAIRKFDNDSSLYYEVFGDSCQVAIDKVTGTDIEVAIPLHLIGETRGECEATQIFVKSETPADWGAWDQDPDLPTDERNAGIRKCVYNYGRKIGDLTTDIRSNNSIARPGTFALEQNYPNPFNPSTSIKYSVNNVQKIDISVYNLLGQKVATLYNGMQTSGMHRVVWNGMNEVGARVSTGMYFYRIQGEKMAITKKMILIK